MEQFIIDIQGKKIIISNVKEAIAEAETYVYFFEVSNNEKMLMYWNQVLNELKKLK